MIIEIKKEDMNIRTSYGDLILVINDELVMTGRKLDIFERLNNILEAWLK